MQTARLDSNAPVATGNNCIAALATMGEMWKERAQVKNEEFEVEMMYSDEYDDFLDRLIPFHQHPRYGELDDEMRTKILSSGWIAYNEKTIDIESKIISPICNEIIYGTLPGTHDETIKWLAAQTLTDEAYHVLMVINTARAARTHRGLLDLRLPSFDLVNKIDLEVAKYSENWQKKLVRASACIVSEVFISDYLSLLSDDDGVQPINRITTEAHRKDELAHSGIFRNLTKEIVRNLTPRELAFFAQMLPRPMRWFASQELSVWETILQQLDYEHTKEVIGDIRAEAEVALFRVDFSELIELAEETGLLDTPEGRESFQAEGLLN
jgi:hypothetical protein